MVLIVLDIQVRQETALVRGRWESGEVELAPLRELWPD